MEVASDDEGDPKLRKVLSYRGPEGRLSGGVAARDAVKRKQGDVGATVLGDGGCAAGRDDGNPKVRRGERLVGVRGYEGASSVASVGTVRVVKDGVIPLGARCGRGGAEPLLSEASLLPKQNWEGGDVFPRGGVVGEECVPE